MYRKIKTLLFAWLLLLVGFNACQANNTTLSKTAETETIDIKARYLLLDEAKGVSKYKGNVVFTKGTLVIQADTVTLFYDGEQLTKALIYGSPADVKHQPEKEEKVHSQAKKMEYFVAKEKLILKGQAFVNQGNRHFSGEYIEYDTQQRIVTANSNLNNPTAAQNNTDNRSPSGRVHVIIGPEAKETREINENDAVEKDQTN